MSRAFVQEDAAAPPPPLERLGEEEADPDAGRIAWTWSLGHALDGAGAGELVERAAGGRTGPVGVLAVEPGES
jgi:transcription elongation GreA/GreB family factor